MTCSSCGEKPKNTSKDFTKAVIEINNPESLVLLRKVVIPASMGDDTEVPPVIGKYRNVLLNYEANNHVYIYSSDGIPTAIIAEIPQEIINQISDLEEAVDNLKDSSDVVDVVSTYAALQSYGTSSLTDNDIVHVLADETHENHSTYYRWNSATSTWTFIGTDAGGAGATNWGSIVGNIADQTDLQQEFGNYTPTANLAAVATSGSYNDLSNKPTIPAAQVNSDWNASSGVASILNKPSLATVATTGAYSDLSGAPTIPTVNDATLTVTQNGVSKGTFSANASSAATIALTDTTYSAFTGATSGAAGASGLVPAPASGETSKYLKSDGTWETISQPTVNDATLTIQQNGTNIATFTANSSSDVTANIPAPVITMQTTDPGEGQPLAANNFVAVYGGAPLNLDYSLTEQDTGTKWIDGSTIYKKTISCGALPDAGVKNIAHGISNISRILKMDGYAYHPSNQFTIPLQFVSTTAINSVVVNASGPNIVITTGIDRSSFTESYITLYYTKSA